MATSIFELYHRKKSSLFESKKSDINIIILTNEREDSNDEDKKLFQTAKRFQEECGKLKIDNYVVFVENARIVRDENNKITIHNVDDKKGFEITQGKTVAIIRGSVVSKKSTLNLITQLEKANIFCINSRDCLEQCSDKYRTVLRLADAGLPTPKTLLIQSMESVPYALEQLEHNFPLIVKTLTGSKGVGVFFVESEKALTSILQVIWKISEDEEMIIQEYIEADHDIRVHVLGDEVMAVMKRHVLDGDFRSNYSQGAKIEEIKISDELKDLCIEASKAVGGIWTGVDLILNNKGEPFIIEINSSPGTEGIEKATGDDIVKQVAKYSIDKSNWILVAQECGYRETIHFEGIGELIAKFDTGNSVLPVVHSDKYTIKGKKVTWTHGKKKFTNKVQGIKEVHVGGLRDYTEERPIILLDITFRGVLYKDIEFVLDDRSNRIPVLLNRGLMRKLNVMVNPSKTFILTVKPKEGKDDNRGKN